MTVSSFAASRPLCFFTILALVVLIVPALVIPWWRGIMNRVEREVDSDYTSLDSLLMSEIEQTAGLLLPLNFTAANLARICSLSLVRNEVSFFDIKTKVAPLMFQTLSVVPNVSEISYIGSDGLFFSYFVDGNQTVSLYANASLRSDSSTYHWYKQQVDPFTGDLHGTPVPSRPILSVANSSWFNKAFNSSSGYSASLEAGWNSDHDLVLINSARLRDEGVISVGVPVKSLRGIFSSMDLNGGRLHLMSSDGKVLLQGLPNTEFSLTAENSVSYKVMSPQGETVQLGNLSCKYPGSSGDNSRAPRITYQNITHLLYCSNIGIMGTESVYVLAIRDDSVKSLIHGKSKLVVVFLISFLAVTFAAILSFIGIIARGTRREIHLCAKLIEQMESTQQAERKSMRKSKAFVEASHNIRTSLACITTLIENSYCEAALIPELEMNLRQMDKCANELLGLLNAILDTSKIEAGEMLLEEEEFDLAQLLEDSVDLFHPFAMKKSVDLVLDFLDGSVLKHSLVRGDKGKLKQVLSNLLHNAVKFTPEGHITVRVSAQKMNLENAIIADNQNGWRKNFRGLFFRKAESYEDARGIDTFQRNPNAMNFVFEVDDTGKGIPKEKRKSVFEDYNQIKDMSTEQGGTGLGLGSVQSFVRLMGGDIKIVDKGIGARGTCFRFNVLLTVLGNLNDLPDKSAKKEDIELAGPSIEANQWPCLTIRTPSPSKSLSIKGLSPRPAGSSTVVLLMVDGERRKVSQSFLERLGIRVCVTGEWTDLPSILRIPQRRLNHSRRNSSMKSDASHHRGESLSRAASNSSSRGSSSSPRGNSHSGFVLLVIDMTLGPIAELVRIVREFQKGARNSTTFCKVVWLDNPWARNRRVLEEEGKLDLQNDYTVSRPFHGSRLVEAIRFLPEFGGSVVAARDQSLKMKDAKTGSSAGSMRELKRSSTPGAVKPLSGKFVLVVEDNAVLQKAAKAVVSNLGANVEVCGNGADAVSVVSSQLSRQRMPAEGASSSTMPSYDFILMDCQMPVMDGYEATRRIRELEEKGQNVHIPIIALTAHSQGPEVKMTFEAGMDSCLQKPLKGDRLMEVLGKLKKPLSGKFVLVVEDNAVLQKAAKAVVCNLGANVEVCENGADAVSVVSSQLSRQRMPAEGASSSTMPSYDFILMDCQMPVMDGYEAAWRIRELEKDYNVRVPIIALTAHSQGPEVNMTFEAGMDSCLQKPLKGDRLMEVLRNLNIT